MHNLWLNSWKIELTLSEPCFELFEFFEAVPKNNPQAHSPQQNKKYLVTTVAFFKVSAPVRLQRH